MKRVGLILLMVFLPLFWANAAKVLRVKGSVHLHNAEGVFLLKKSSKLKTGDIISTNKKRSLAIIELSNGSRLKLNKGSRIKIKDGDDAEVNLTSGSLFSKFRKQPNKSLTVKTRSAVAGVRGTEFFTSYGGRGKKNDVWLCVRKGKVEVKNKKTGSTVAVEEGEGIGIEKGKETSKPKPLPWTKKLNWNVDPESDDLENQVDIADAYNDLLDQDYD